MAVGLIVGCGGGGSSDNGTTTPPEPTQPPSVSLVIPIDGNTVKNFSFLDENVLMTRGCVSANLYDSSNNALDVDIDTNIGLATQGNYKYIADKYFNNSYTAYAIVYAKSMNVIPESLEDGVTYSYPPGAKDIKKLTINETKTLVATASSSAHIQVYDSNLNFVDEIQDPIDLVAGTYYLLFIGGSCINGTKITVNIL